MLFALLAVAAAALDAGTGYQPLAGDGGFALDAGELGIVLDRSSIDAGSAAVPVAPRLAVRIVGARALPNEVLLDAIDVDRDAGPDEATARKVQDQLSRYLIRTGFELATVKATASEAGIEVDVDEGRIERILCVGQLSFQQLRFKLSISLPHDIFNRPLLDRQVRELAESMGLRDVRWELVQTAAVKHVGPQIDRLPEPMNLALLGSSLIHARRPYEVHIIFPDVDPHGLIVDLRSGYIDGVEVAAAYRQPSALFDGDRAWAMTSGGIGARYRVDTGALYAHFSRAFAELGYDLFPLAGHTRFEVFARGELVSRQRPDLWLEDYEALDVGAGAQLEVTFAPAVRFALAAGFEWRRLFGFTTPDGSPLASGIELADRKRPFLSFTDEIALPPFTPRRERQHLLASDLRLYAPVSGREPLLVFDGNYRWVLGLGWHEVRVNARARIAIGDVTFHDELSVGELTTGVFGGQFSRAAAGLRAEFRFSISRDLLKVGIFADLAAMGVQPHRDDPTLYAQLIESFGPSVHHTVLDLFQVDLFFTCGFRRGEFAFAPVLMVQTIY